ncbi:MAG: nucleotidyltransferase domain-containing protein [Proteobacteria bacterium]|nr:nucleotidyltransferase domain-containing protein [Pseudomonadota bacterium]
MTKTNKAINPFGLTDRDMKTCEDILKKYLDVTRVFIFGSRAKGDYHIGSDLDLAIMNPLSNKTLVQKIKADFDESSLPFFVDLVHYPSLDHPDLKSHIDRVGALFFQRVF